MCWITTVPTTHHTAQEYSNETTTFSSGLRTKEEEKEEEVPPSTSTSALPVHDDDAIKPYVDAKQGYIIVLNTPVPSSRIQRLLRDREKASQLYDKDTDDEMVKQYRQAAGDNMFYYSYVDPFLEAMGIPTGHVNKDHGLYVVANRLPFSAMITLEMSRGGFLRAILGCVNVLDVSGQEESLDYVTRTTVSTTPQEYSTETTTFLSGLRTKKEEKEEEVPPSTSTSALPVHDDDAIKPYVDAKQGYIIVLAAGFNDTLRLGLVEGCSLKSSNQQLIVKDIEQKFLPEHLKELFINLCPDPNTKISVLGGIDSNHFIQALEYLQVDQEEQHHKDQKNRIASRKAYDEFQDALNKLKARTAADDNVNNSTESSDDSCTKPPARPLSNKKKKIVTVLSIDGGGIRGLFTSVIIFKIEAKLKEVFGEDARIAHYFDVIIGASTGALISLMLTAPDKNNQPLCTAEEVKNFYLEEGPKIFPPPAGGILGKIANMLRMLWGPKYDGSHLKKLAKKMFGDSRLSDTLTNVVVPVIDVNAPKSELDVVFSRNKLKDQDPSMNIYLSDLSIGATAAPSYLPLHTFTNGTRTFAAVDGGLFANDPVSIGLAEAVKDAIKAGKKEDVKDEEIEFLVLSIGTGSDKMSKEASYRSENTSKSSILSWMLDIKSWCCPIFDLSSDLISCWDNRHFSRLYEDNKITCLRLQDDKLKRASLDDSSKEYMDELKASAERLYADRFDDISLFVEILRRKHRCDQLEAAGNV